MEKLKERSKIFLIIIVIAFVLSGCFSSKALRYYPNYIERKEDISSLSLFTDVTIFNDGWEDGRIVNLPLSLELSDSVLKKLEKDFRSKNYLIKNIYPPAVGIFTGNDSTKYKIYETISDYDKNIDSLKYASPPFCLDTNQTKKELKFIFDKNIAYYDENNKTKNIDSTIKVNGDFIFVFRLESNDVSFSKSLGEGLLTALFTLGTVSVYSVSYTLATYWIIDVKTGETILSDKKYLQGENTDKNNVVEILMDFLKVIPAKIN